MKFYRGKRNKANSNMQRSIGAMQGGYLVANTDYMSRRWHSAATFRNSQIDPSYNDYTMNSLSQAYRGTQQLIAAIDKMLDQTIRSQDIGLRKWLSQLQRRGIINQGISPSGQNIKKIYDIVSQLSVIGSQVNLKMIRQASSYSQMEKEIAQAVDESIKKYNPYTYVRKALLEAMRQQGVKTLVMNPQLIQNILDKVKAQITALIFEQSTKLTAKIQKEDYDWSSALRQQISNAYDELYGPRLRQVLSRAEKQQYKLDDNNRILTKYRGQSQETLTMMFHSKNNQGGFQGWLGSEIMSAIGGIGLGADAVYHTGKSATRATGSFYVGNAVVTKNNNQSGLSQANKARMVQNKDDAQWVYNLKDGKSQITIHISAKLYSRRGPSNQQATQGLSQLKLQQGGTLDLRSRQLQSLIKKQIGAGGETNYQKLMFGLVNLSKDSLIPHGQKVKAQYEASLAAMFAAFMFNASRQQITGWLPSQYKKAENHNHDIYIFNVDGMYVTLAQMAQQAKNNFHDMLQDYKNEDISKMIHVSITPSDYNAIGDKAQGSMNLSIGTVNPQIDGPFSQEDWVDIRNRIINTTKISVVTADLNSFFDNLQR